MLGYHWGIVKWLDLILYLGSRRSQFAYEAGNMYKVNSVMCDHKKGDCVFDIHRNEEDRTGNKEDWTVK